MAQNLSQHPRLPESKSLLNGLPALASLIPPTSDEREKVGLILRLLRQAALGTRASRSQPFYSIRAVASHFSVPPTTVTRLYSQLKEEGVLGTIWGSKTIIEPADINKEIRIRALVGLPAAFTAFATLRNYRLFFLTMQDTLWKAGFGTRLIFYEEETLDSSEICDPLVGYKVDFVIWLAKNPRISSAIRRLADRGIRSVKLWDGLPINGDIGYYLSRRNALIEGLATWRRSGVRSVQLVKASNEANPNRQRMLQECLIDAGLSIGKEDSAGWNRATRDCRHRDTGVIFTSGDAFIQYAAKDCQESFAILKNRRALLLDGWIDLPGDRSTGRLLDTIEFEWRPIVRRVCRDVVAGTRGSAQERIVFEANWHSPSDEPRRR